MTGSRAPATSQIQQVNQSPAFNPSAIHPGGHVPSKSCPSGADQSSQEKLEDFLRKARAL